MAAPTSKIIWEMDTAEVHDWVKSLDVANAVKKKEADDSSNGSSSRSSSPLPFSTSPLTNAEIITRLKTTLSSLNYSPPPTTAEAKLSTPPLPDPFSLKFNPTLEPTTCGELLCRMTRQQWLNALAGIVGGVTESTIERQSAAAAIANKKKKKKSTSPVPPGVIDTNNYPHLKVVAQVLMQACNSRIAADQTRSMPDRIRMYFCPYAQQSDVTKYMVSVKKTSQGEGTHSSAKTLSREPDAQKNRIVVDNNQNINDDHNWEVCSSCQVRDWDRFKRALNDETRSNVFRTILINKKNLILDKRNVYYEIKNWSLANFEKWCQTLPDWFGENLVSYIPDDMIPDSCKVYKPSGRKRNKTISEIQVRERFHRLN